VCAADQALAHHYQWLLHAALLDAHPMLQLRSQPFLHRPEEMLDSGARLLQSNQEMGKQK
jgi:hypothetical protein